MLTWRSTSDVFEPSCSSRPAKMSLCSCTSGCSGCAVVRARLMSATVPATGTVSLSGSSVALDGDLITSSNVAIGAEQRWDGDRAASSSQRPRERLQESAPPAKVVSYQNNGRPSVENASSGGAAHPFRRGKRDGKTHNNERAAKRAAARPRRAGERNGRPLSPPCSRRVASRSISTLPTLPHFSHHPSNSPAAGAA